MTNYQLSDMCLHYEKAARTGKNPQTGEAIKIPAAVVPKFKPGKALKDAVNKK